MAENKQQSGILKRVSTLQDGDSSEAIYDDWSENYDEDLTDEWGYIAPQLSVQALEEVCTDKTISIMDLGCGTGLVGVQLSKAGYTTFDGTDISQGMLDQAAAKAIYRTLTRSDLTEKTPFPTGEYDAALCIGSMGAGHVDASHVPEMMRIIKPGGVLVIHTNATYYDKCNFAERFTELERQNVWRIHRSEVQNYMEALERPGYLIVATKPGY